MSIENRRHPRYPAALEVEAAGLPISSRNVSLSGMQLSCPSMNYRLLHERFERGAVALVITLPGGENVSVGARRVYASPYDDEYLIGVTLSGLSAPHGRSFRAYVERLAAGRG